MKYVAIDCSASNLIVLVSNGDKVQKYVGESSLGKHSSVLLPKIDELLEQAKLTLDKIDFFACVVGAGSFTGIRIGVSTITALAFANSKPVLRITSFDSLAYNMNGGKILAVIDAKHDGFYVCGYSDNKVVLEEQYIDKNQLLQIASEYQMVSDSEIQGLSVLVVDRALGFEKAIEDKKDLITYDLSQLTPLYCRKSQAEEGR